MRRRPRDQSPPEVLPFPPLPCNLPGIHEPTPMHPRHLSRQLPDRARKRQLLRGAHPHKRPARVQVHRGKLIMACGIIKTFRYFRLGSSFLLLIQTRPRYPWQNHPSARNQSALNRTLAPWPCRFSGGSRRGIPWCIFLAIHPEPLPKTTRLPMQKEVRAIYDEIRKLWSDNYPRFARKTRHSPAPSSSIQFFSYLGWHFLTEVQHAKGKACPNPQTPRLLPLHPRRDSDLRPLRNRY